MSKIAFLTLVVCTLALAGCLDHPPCPPCQESATDFLGTLAQGRTKPAFDQLFEQSLLSKKSLKSQQFVRLTNGLLRQYGDIKSYEMAGSREVGRINSVSYLLYQERGASRWHFFFYRAPGSDRWLLLDLNASDQSGFLVQEYP